MDIHGTDSDGLTKAYESDNNLYLKDGTLYIAGTKGIRDAITDTTILFGGLQDTYRYKNAFLTARDNHVHTVVGHSLGSAIGQRIAEKLPTIRARLYGSPSVTGVQSNRIKYYRHRFDPISGLNMMPNVEQTVHLGNPHSYRGF